ncbi:outer membrane beta-barrel protein [Aurantiacibacter poecillastricola]|uniref:outer membrane beta-barrel protein n=1 Tax=Aurantiacibacter poecillastricola TaxID=3064385 RepID=UPI00273EB306|nr:outer membrane beta-barrel protein [Aurantiacibacter sp. 219JJ12-13]MDP5259992.1 outer membrane beta-barrel protein [Aurantiacibacter sp. 219JJ12-13]
MSGVRALRTGLQVMAVASAAATMPALAQDDDDIAPPRLPRPGYDYEGIQDGNTTILAEADVRLDYASNIFLTSDNEQDDLRLLVSPSIAVTQQVSTGSIGAEVHGGFTRHLETERENSNTFGGSLAMGLSPTRGRQLQALFAYDRSIERRGDPETQAGPTDPPQKIDLLLAETSYRQAIGDFRFGAELGAEKINLLDPAEDDRDLTSYRASVRLGYNISPAFDVFLQPYVNSRDFRLPVDFSGVDRDANTYGLLVGVERELGARLQGNFGVGIFRTDPEDDVIPAYTGASASASITWQPRARTAVNFRLERGNVATVRSGATTRVDTIARLRLDQEIRHNLLGQVTVSYTDRYYLGSQQGHLRTGGAQVGLEYLLTRRFSVYTAATYQQRNALADIDEYDSFVFSIGLRSRL